MEMVYETKDRKPFKLQRISFFEADFDGEGIYDFSDEAASKEMGIELEYIFYDIWTGDNTPLPIPIFPVIPSKDEIKILKNYLNDNYPHLLNNSPAALENYVRNRKRKHEENIERMKRSHRRRRKEE